ncbi:tail assembly chaperone [Zhenpiania hominis]|uniref:tail assembly chaperone n=1 Tax=Zhenpiania hominis TaxID=2763644 RepID=UPI0039F4D626
MFELTINEQVYQFKFGIGFVKEINKTATKPVDGIPGEMEEVGLRYSIAKIMDGDVLELIRVLVLANKGFEPRVTYGVLETYIDEELEDIDELFGTVMDFLEKANATKRIMKALLKAVQEAEENA